MVLSLMTQPGGPPPIPPPTGGPLETVIDMLCALDAFVRVMMSHAYPVGGKDLVTLHVLDFLNAFDAFKPLREERKFPEWLTMYNFLCLLNLPDSIEELGPLRFNYEGSTEGEGFIPMVKPLLAQGMRKNWQRNLAHRFYRKRAMKLVLRDARVFIGQDSLNDTDYNSNKTQKMFQKYKGWQQVEGNVLKGLPISLVLLQNGFMGAVINDRENWLLVPFRLMDFVKAHSGMNYFRVQLFERDPFGRVTRNVVNIGRQADFLHYCLLLPFLNEQKYQVSDSHIWTVVGSEYERLDSTGMLQGVYDLPVNLREAVDTMVADHEEDGAVELQENQFVQEAEEDMLDDETGELDEAGATPEDLLGIGYI